MAHMIAPYILDLSAPLPRRSSLLRHFVIDELGKTPVRVDQSGSTRMIYGPSTSWSTGRRDSLEIKGFWSQILL